jgi:apurinic endonuclease APN1
MMLGLHVRSGGGVEHAPGRAAAEGGETVQIFAGSPRMWKQPTYSREQGEKFAAAMEEHGLAEAFIHVMYLTSYGTADEEHRRKSTQAFITALENCDTLGARGAVTHLGSHKGEGFEVALPRIRDCLMEVLASDTEAEVILENSAGAGDLIGGTFGELQRIIEACEDHSRLKVCLDTAHAFTSGYDLRTAEAWEQLLSQFDDTIGLDRLSVLHLNDSMHDINTYKDRHENIGDGYIGYEAFQALVNDTRFNDMSGILEVPGIDNKGPDKENLDRLNRLKGLVNERSRSANHHT